MQKTIKKITAYGWKSGPIDMEVGMVNVLVGRNGSGKTSVMDAARLAIYGDNQTLGKQNQSLAKGASDKSVSCSVVMSDGSSFGTKLTRSGDSVSRKTERAYLKQEIPLTPTDLMSLSAEQMRALMTIDGHGTHTAAEFIDEVCNIAGEDCRGPLLLCKVEGAGGVDAASQWSANICEQSRIMQANIREMKNALSVTQKSISDSEAVPKAMIFKWEDELRELKEKKSKAEDIINNALTSEHKLENLRNTLAYAKATLSERQAVRLELQTAIAELGEPPVTSKAELDAIDSEISSLAIDRKRKDSDATTLAVLKHQIVKLATHASELASDISTPRNVSALLAGAASEMTKAAQQIPTVSQDHMLQLESIDKQIESLMKQRSSLLKPEAEYREKLKQKTNSDSYEHAMDRLGKLSLECASIHREVVDTENRILEIKTASGQDAEKEAEQCRIDAIEVSKKIAAARSYADLVANERGLQESIDNLSSKAEPLQRAASASLLVFCQWLSEPIAALQPHLDAFCKEIGLGNIEASFSKEGRSLTLGIWLVDGKNRIHLDAVSGGEKAMVGTAFLYAVNMVRKPEVPLMLIESAEIDQENAKAILAGLKLAAANGIQSFMTNFEMIDGEGIEIKQREAVLC